jgi:hypothetical protein
MKVYLSFGLARHDPRNGDWAMPGLRLTLGRPARHGPFLFCDVSGHDPEGTSPAELRPGRPGTARWLGIVPRITEISSPIFLPQHS